MSTVQTATVADLRPVDLFDDLDDEALAPWAAAAQLRETAAGETFVEQNAPSNGLILLLDGTLRLSQLDGDRLEPFGRQYGPTWIGAIAALTDGLVPVQMDCETACRVAIIPPEAFETLALATPPVHRRIMKQVAPVLTNLGAIEQNRERLTSLGTMAAGLAHELNNPASAAKRAAAELSEALDVLASVVAHFVEAGLERSDAVELVALQREALDHAAACTMLDVLDAADAEEALQERLEDMGVKEPWRAAEPLAVAGVTADWLDRVELHAGSATDVAISWIVASLTARSLANDVGESADRISGLVKAIKNYAYMDRGETVEIDIHEGLETTLVVLGHKLKHTQIEVVRDYDRDLPKIMVRGAELNQVWTNLLDNAIGALGQTGTITVRTRRDGNCMEIDIADDGPGIPADIRDHIFDPFFTTKAVGSGTGLGLDVARRIVVDRHDGSIRVASEPGETTFTVRLPIGGDR